MLKRSELIGTLSVVLIVAFGSVGASFAQMQDSVTMTQQQQQHGDQWRGEEHRAGQREHAERRDKHKKKPQTVQMGPQTVCAYDVPRGWIKTNDRWDPTSCGNPTAIVYNVWTIERYLDRPVGSVMRVCSGVVPRGWMIVDSTWVPTACGHPTAILKNVMMIRKVE